MRIIITGDFQNAEFREAFEASSQSGCDFEYAELKDLVKPNPANIQESIDAIVVSQSRRGQISNGQILKLCEHFPLAERVLVYGSWCEGETRSGIPVAGIRRVHVLEWPTVLDNWLNVAVGQPGSMRGQLVTMNRADELMSGFINDHRELPQLNILVSSRCPDFLKTMNAFGDSQDWRVSELAGARMNSGNTAASSSQIGKHDLLICECYYSSEEAVSLLTKQPSLQALPIVVVLGFARLQDSSSLCKMKIQHALLGKPFKNETLLSSIRGLLQNRKLSVVSDVA